MYPHALYNARIGLHIWESFYAVLFLLRLFMQELLREIILQPNYTVIMEMRGSCLETQTQNDDETVMSACVCVAVCVAAGRANGVR